MNVKYNILPFQPRAYQYLPYWYDDEKEGPTKQEDVVQETRQKEVRTFTHFN